MSTVRMSGPVFRSCSSSPPRGKVAVASASSTRARSRPSPQSTAGRSASWSRPHLHLVGCLVPGGVAYARRDGQLRLLALAQRDGDRSQLLALQLQFQLLRDAGIDGFRLRLQLLPARGCGAGLERAGGGTTTTPLCFSSRCLPLPERSKLSSVSAGLGTSSPAPPPPPSPPARVSRGREENGLAVGVDRVDTRQVDGGAVDLGAAADDVGNTVPRLDRVRVLVSLEHIAAKAAVEEVGAEPADQPIRPASPRSTSLKSVPWESLTFVSVSVPLPPVF